MSKPLALQRAEHALAAVHGFIGPPKKDFGKYVSYVEGLPANILRSGLGQAMAMENAGAAKSGDEAKGHGFLFAQIEAWLTSEQGWSNTQYRNKGGLMRAIVSGDQDQYIRAQAEALAYLEWLKKFAVAFLKDETDQAATAQEAGR